jgi:RNA recognition motif-containing protein
LNLYVGNLAYATTDADLRQAFAGFGALRSARIVYDRDTGRSRGFGFVDMEIRAEGEAAMAALHGSEFQGRKLRISEANA